MGPPQGSVEGKENLPDLLPTQGIAQGGRMRGFPSKWQGRILAAAVKQLRGRKVLEAGVVTAVEEGGRRICLVSTLRRK